MKTKIDRLIGKTEGTNINPIKSESAYSSKKVWINRICNSLSRDTSRYDPEKTIHSLKAYVNKEERLLYSEISNYIFSLDDDAIGRFVTNLEKLVEYFSSLSNNDEKCERIVFKLYDHSQLAIAQTRNLVKDDDDFQRMIENRLNPVYAQFDKAVEQAKKDVNSQLISLVGIFTALSFLIFGGINSLDNIFSGLTNLPILKLMIIGCVWGLCILNLVFVFMYFIAKITGTSIKTNHRPSANFIQRYPFFIWSDFLIFITMLICSWMYYIDEKDIGGWFVNMGKRNQTVICIAGFVIIGVVFVS